MKSGVRKSGWPMPRLMMSRPCDINCMARASTAKAFSSPIRSKAAMVFSMAFPPPPPPPPRQRGREGWGRAVQQNRPSNANAMGRAKSKSPGRMSGALHISVYAKREPSSVYAGRNRADHVVVRAGLARISAAAAGRAVRIGGDIGGGACGRVLQPLNRGRMMLRGKSRRGEQRNAENRKHQLGVERFHFAVSDYGHPWSSRYSGFCAAQVSYGHPLVTIMLA